MYTHVAKHTSSYLYLKLKCIMGEHIHVPRPKTGNLSQSYDLGLGRPGDKPRVNPVVWILPFL